MSHEAALSQGTETKQKRKSQNGSVLSQLAEREKEEKKRNDEEFKNKLPGLKSIKND